MHYYNLVKLGLVFLFVCVFSSTSFACEKNNQSFEVEIYNTDTNISVKYDESNSVKECDSEKCRFETQAFTLEVYKVGLAFLIEKTDNGFDIKLEEPMFWDDQLTTVMFNRVDLIVIESQLF